MSKSNVAKKLPASPAQMGLEELLVITGEDDDNGSSSPQSAGSTTVSSAGLGDDEMESTGGGARVEIFYGHKAYKNPKDNQKVIAEGDEFDGTYEGSFVSGKFKSRTHKITLGGNGTVIGLPTCGRLDKAFQFVPVGTRSIVKFTGIGEIKTGEWKGQESYNYDVALPKSINAKIKLGELNSNYELKKSN